MLCDHHSEMKTEEHFENQRGFKGLKSVSVGVSLQKHMCMGKGQLNKPSY